MMSAARNTCRIQFATLELSSLYIGDMWCYLLAAYEYTSASQNLSHLFLCILMITVNTKSTGVFVVLV